jgi:Protein of unknown function (DUF1344)
MKTIFAALIATAAFAGFAQAGTVTGTLQSFDQVTGTIVLDNGMAYAVTNSNDDETVITPIAAGSSVMLTIDDGTKLVTDIRTAR